MKNLINTKIIEKYMTENGLNKIRFCKKCQITYGTLNKLFKGENMRISTVRKIAVGMETHILQLFSEE